MATKTLKTKFQLRYDTLANWTSKNPTLLAGEIAVVSVPTTSSTTVEQVTKPAILFKVGDGTTPFNTLPYASGKAADVYAWAKAAEKPTYTAAEVGLGNVLNVASYSKTEVDNMLSGIEGQLQVDTNTEYQLVNDGTKIKLQSKAKGASSWTDEEEYDLATVLANTFDAKGDAEGAYDEAVSYTDTEISELVLGNKKFTKVAVTGGLDLTNGAIKWQPGNGTAKIELDDSTDYINVANGIEINGTKLEDIYAAKGHTHTTYENALEDLGNRIDQHTQDINGIGNLAQSTEAKVNAFLDAEGIKDSTLDTLSEIQKFITDEAAAADQLVTRIGAVETAVGTVDSRIENAVEDAKEEIAGGYLPVGGFVDKAYSSLKLSAEYVNPNAPEEAQIDEGSINLHASEVSITTPHDSWAKIKLECDGQSAPVAEITAYRIELNASNTLELQGGESLQLISENKPVWKESWNGDEYELVTADQLEDAVADLDGRLQTAEGTIEDHTAAIGELQQGFAQSNHSHTNKTVLDGITSTKVTNWDNEVGAKAALETFETDLKTGNVPFNKISFPAEGGANIQINGETSRFDIIAPDGVNINSIYENNVALSEKYLGKTAQAADAAKLGGQVAAYYASAQSVNDVASDLIGVTNRVKALEDVDTLILQGGGAGDNYA